MSRRLPALRLRLAAAAAAGGLVLVACSAGSPSADPSDSARIPVTVTEQGCDPASLSATAGAIVFEVTNGGPEAGEFEILDGDAVLHEVEDIVPSLAAELSVQLEAGEYQLICYADRSPRGTLVVTADPGA